MSIAIEPTAMPLAVGEPVYLGDGAYAVLESSNQICIYTSNGIETLNRIYLEPSTERTLMMFLKRVKETRRKYGVEQGS